MLKRACEQNFAKTITNEKVGVMSAPRALIDEKQHPVDDSESNWRCFSLSQTNKLLDQFITIGENMDLLLETRIQKAYFGPLGAEYYTNVVGNIFNSIT